MNPWATLGSLAAILGLAGLARALGLGAPEPLTEADVVQAAHHERPGASIGRVTLSGDAMSATVETDGGPLTVTRHGVGTVVRPA